MDSILKIKVVKSLLSSCLKEKIDHVFLVYISRHWIENIQKHTSIACGVVLVSYGHTTLSLETLLF